MAQEPLLMFVEQIAVVVTFWPQPQFRQQFWALVIQSY